MATKKEWFDAAKVRSLPASVSPVLVALGATHSVSKILWIRFILALITSLFLQLTLNYVNDYQEGKKGVDFNKIGDGEHLVQPNIAGEKDMLKATLVCGAVAAVTGFALVTSFCLDSGFSKGWWLYIGGIVCFLCAWFYVGGKYPYGYHALSEIVIIGTFGLFAVLATIYTQNAPVVWQFWALAFAVGFLSNNILMNDNLRDINHDPKVNKITLAVKIGEKNSRIVYMVQFVIAYGLVVACAINHPTLWLIFLSFPIAIYLTIQITFKKATGKVLRACLDKTGQLQLLFGILSAIALWFAKF